MRALWTLAALSAAALSACGTVEPSSAPDPSEGLFTDYRGGPQIVRGRNDGATEAQGVVFEDLNRNARFDEGEPGIAGVKVSNGIDVVLTQRNGAYTLPAREDMAVMVIQPQGYQVPHNDDWVPQFAYQHKPQGSPKPLRYGGLPPSGALPEAIHFPLIRTKTTDAFRCTVMGDPQTYSHQEIGYFRDSTIDDLLDRDEPSDCILTVGDVMGDDLGLIPRMAEVIGTLQQPQWWVHGNHDYDYDADTDDDSADTWRRLYGPNYYAFEIGEALIIALDNVVYPCTAKDAATSGHDDCVTGDQKRYNGRISDAQMTWVENLLALTPKDRLIIVAHHIPLVSFIDQQSPIHQTDNVTALYRLFEGREALSLSGHTHTTEMLEPGDSFAGWQAAVGVSALPFRHIIAGATSGAWYQGDVSHDGTPMALQRMGAPKGWMELDVQGRDYRETYRGANMGRERRMWLSVNTPIFRSWFRQIMAWKNTPEADRDPVPPLSINDLPDVKIMTRRDLARGTYITANIWDGSSATTASLTIAERTLTMQRTQSASGETTKVGPEWADPYAAQRQLSVGRYALESRSGIGRNQGFESFGGSSFGPAAPQPQRSVADRNLHLWRAQLPADLALGVHEVVVEAVDRHGRRTRDTMVIEVRESLPPARFRRDLFDSFDNGPPVRNAP